MTSRTPILAVLLSFAGGPCALAAEPDPLARKAHEILKANCYRCHGQGGSNEGGFSYVLDRTRLVASNKIVPGKIDTSRLLKRVIKGDMPPEDEKPRPSDADIASLKRWIEAGAPDFNPPAAQRKAIAAEDLFDAIRFDLKAMNERDRRYARYFTLTHLYNAGWSEEELDSQRIALAKLVNSLSWGKRIVKPTAIDPPAKTVLRIDLRDYKWNEKTWETILSSYPYGVRHGSANAKYCYDTTECRLPHVRVDWFVAAGSQPPLYHEVLQLPTTDRELERLLQVDVAENIRQERVARAGFNGSGVSRSNRLIERHESPHGAYWKSYDFAASAGRQNLFEYPLGPVADRPFQHDGGEIIFSLPNGLQGYLLVDARGNRIDRGPTTIVSDPKQPDRAVVNGISCMSCHAKGMIDKADQIRDSVLKNPKAFEKKEADAILALYPAKKDFDKLLQQDAERFAKAVAETGGRIDRHGKIIGSDPVVNVASLFERDLDLALAVAEVGVKAEVFQKALDRSPRLGRALGSVRVEGGTLPRQQFVAAYRELVEGLEVGIFVPPSREDRPTAAAPPAADSGKITDILLAQALEDLKSMDPRQRQAACERLTTVEPVMHRERIAKAIETLLADADAHTAQAGLKAIAVWGTRDNVPALLKLLKHDDRGVRKNCLPALANFKDERTTAPLAECLVDGATRGEAIKALQSLGRMAEKDVLKYVMHSDARVGGAACQVLKEIGTRESIPALLAASRARSIFLNRPAQDALKEVRARMNEK